MKLSKEFIKQIILLMVVATALVLIVTNSGKVLTGIGTCITIIAPFLAGGAIAFILNIPMSAIEKRLLCKWDGTKAAKFKRPVSMLLTLLAFVAVIALLIMIIVPNLSATFAEIAKQFPVFLDEAAKWLTQMGVPGFEEDANILETLSKTFEDFNEKIVTFIKQGASSFLGQTVHVVTSVISTVVSTVIAFVFAIYALSQKERLARQSLKVLNAYVPEKHVKRILKVCKLLKKNFTSFITGQCLDASILGALFVIVLTVVRVPYGLMIGVVIAFTALIPLVGAFLGCVIGIVLILMVNPIKIITFLICFIILQQLEGKLIYPRVVGGAVGLPAIWVLVAIAVGGSLFGVVGMLIFIPIVSTIYTLLREDVNRRLKAKQ